ncbi:MAG: AAA family ATPase, partial [Hyalangium sp.]|uniref:AAA family ATPase n=1 Tax=Hyalangium sp. TaxID=2028555 RepID=UPI00389A870B
MIHRLTLKNFKGIESAELDLERLTVIVGPNASGKTTVLQALHLLLALSNPNTVRSELFAQHGGIAALQRRGSQDEEGLIRAHGSWQDQPGTLWMEFAATNHPRRANGQN